jgi:uncharacterized protein YcfL
MRKFLLVVIFMWAFMGLVGCQSKAPNEDLETDGTQESIFDSISEAIKNVFD